MSLEHAMRVGELLTQLQHEKIVFAESCTGGMAAALMTQVPGISSFFCGSAVTYREPTKIEWLGIDSQTLAQHTAESEQTTSEMAERVLARTPEASISVATTGHLGPGAPSDIDGLIFVCAARRADDSSGNAQAIELVLSKQFRLQAIDRVSRQREAAGHFLEVVHSVLSSLPK